MRPIRRPIVGAAPVSRHRSNAGLRLPSHRLPVRTVSAARWVLRYGPMAARSLRRLTGVATLALGMCCLAACRPVSVAEPEPVLIENPVDALEEGGAVSTVPVEQLPPATDLPPHRQAIDWADKQLDDSRAWLGCELDYVQKGDGAPLSTLDREALTAILEPCKDTDVLRLRYQGRMTGEFSALVKRVTSVADALGIGKRILDVDSTGGQVEEAIHIGDYIAESRWTIWVREDSLCHSACVFVLGAGDIRLIAGRVGIHRIIRMSSTATTRAELDKELRVVYDRVRGYLERNGVALAVADLMRAVPNRNLRLLTSDELRLYGLDGVNPAQDDLVRLSLMRECGEGFVRRRDAFMRAFDRSCKAGDAGLDTVNACGLALRGDYGFPDEACPLESPMSEFDFGAGYVLASGHGEPSADASPVRGVPPPVPSVGLPSSMNPPD